MGKLLCRLGFHSWHMWFTESLGYGDVRQSYRCRRCKKDKVVNFSSGFPR